MRCAHICFAADKIRPGSQNCPERMFLLTREVYARFADVDTAEAAVRTLRRQCKGVHAFQIRSRSRQKGESNILPASAFAMWGASGDLVADRPSMPSAVIPAGVWDDVQDTASDGPAAREDCLLEVVVDREYAARAEAVLHAEHGYGIFQTGADLVR